MNTTFARFCLGQPVRHRDAGFRGVVIDVDPRFEGEPEDTGSISPDQPYYQVLSIEAGFGFIAYAPEDTLELDAEAETLSQVDANRWFNVDAKGRHAPKAQAIH
jgi:heat shock protein HspQ